jgi:hypothetical protein
VPVVINSSGTDQGASSPLDRNSKKYFERRRSALDLERQSFIAHYKELSEHVRPRKGRFETEDRNRGTRERKHKAIINSAGTKALRTATAGLVAGVMSPTRPWFALDAGDPALLEFQPVKIWLDQAERLIRAIFNASNLYSMAPTMLSELLLFGTGCMSHLDDFEDVARFFTHTAGSYMISQNERYEVDTMIREFQMTTEQMVTMFGLKAVSPKVSTAFANGNLSLWFDVVQIIEPNPNAITGPRFADQMPFRSVFYEPGGDGALETDGVLLIKGFEEFPVYAPRWDVTGEDIYGTDCPGMQALGDIKGLQIQERRKAQAIDKMVNPPLKGPASLRNVPIESLPGGVTLYESDQNPEGLQPIYTVNPQINDLVNNMQVTERRIGETFFNDLFLAITNMEGIQPRNQLDIQSRNEERLLQLGPVLERIQGDFLTKVVERTFNQALRANIMPDAPPELEGRELDVKFISSLAIAQRTAAIGPIQQLVQFVGGMGQLVPTALDKFDADQAIDEFAEAVGAPAKLVKPDEDVAATRQARAQQQQRQQMAELAATGASAVKDLSESNADGEGNVLKAIQEAQQGRT